MATLSELIKEKNKLAKGNVYIKKINGKEYFYYQYFDNGSRFTKIIDKKTADNIKEQVKKRKELEKQIKEIRSKDKYYSLSNNSKNLTGYVMSGNTVVAEFNHGNLVFIDEKLAPLVIKKTHSIEKFLSLRVIDMSRTNARLLKKALNMETDEEYKLSLYAYALSVSDNYWFKPKHSKLKYDDINIKNDIYSDISLKGDMTVTPYQNRLTPEITTTGSFEKGWKLVDNHWWLYKSGNVKQKYSEIFCSKFAELIGLNTVTYELDGEYIRCKNFAEKYNYEPIASLAGDNDNYNHIFDIIYKINVDIAKDYLKLIFFDSVINNVDRHNENVGLLRNKNNGAIISLAPNFDNNLALISNIDTLTSPQKDGFIKVLVNFLNNNQTALSLFKAIELKDISINDIIQINDSIDIDVPNKEDVSYKVFNRYYYLKNKF